MVPEESRRITTMVAKGSNRGASIAEAVTEKPLGISTWKQSPTLPRLI
jgi:hypothetical protein